MLRHSLLAACAAATLCAFQPLHAADQTIALRDAYARASTAMSRSGAAFMEIVNTGDADDRLIAASSPAADRVELHTHREDASGVMRMMEVEEGFAVPAGGTRALARGGDHVMFLGITQPFEQGATVPLTLTFERAGDITLEVPVDLTRGPGGGGHHGHGGHGGAMSGGQ